jgi:hypothetical protein
MASRESELLAELLSTLTEHGRWAGIEPGLGGSGMSRTPESSEDTVYGEMPKPIGLPRGFPVRVMVLTPEEVAAASKRFGTFFPMHIKIFFDRQHERAHVDWDESWRGGSFRAVWRDGWHLTALGQWIT